MKINERIKTRRKELGLTLKQVADKLNVSESLISRYESNDVKNMGIDKIGPLAKVLKTTPAYLMGWEEKNEVRDEIILTPDQENELEYYLEYNRLFFKRNKMNEEDAEKLDRILRDFYISTLNNKEE